MQAAAAIARLQEEHERHDLTPEARLAAKKEFDARLRAEHTADRQHRSASLGRGRSHTPPSRPRANAKRRSGTTSPTGGARRGSSPAAAANHKRRHAASASQSRTVSAGRQRLAQQPAATAAAAQQQQQLLLRGAVANEVERANQGMASREFAQLVLQLHQKLEGVQQQKDRNAWLDEIAAEPRSDGQAPASASAGTSQQPGVFSAQGSGHGVLPASQAYLLVPATAAAGPAPAQGQGQLVYAVPLLPQPQSQFVQSNPLFQLQPYSGTASQAVSSPDAGSPPLPASPTGRRAGAEPQQAWQQAVQQPGSMQFDEGVQAGPGLGAPMDSPEPKAVAKKARMAVVDEGEGLPRAAAAAAAVEARPASAAGSWQLRSSSAGGGASMATRAAYTPTELDELALEVRCVCAAASACTVLNRVSCMPEGPGGGCFNVVKLEALMADVGGCMVRAQPQPPRVRPHIAKGHWCSTPGFAGSSAGWTFQSFGPLRLPTHSSPPRGSSQCVCLSCIGAELAWPTCSATAGWPGNSSAPSWPAHPDPLCSSGRVSWEAGRGRPLPAAQHRQWHRVGIRPCARRWRRRRCLR